MTIVIIIIIMPIIMTGVSRRQRQIANRLSSTTKYCMTNNKSCTTNDSSQSQCSVRCLQIALNTAIAICELSCTTSRARTTNRNHNADCDLSRQIVLNIVIAIFCSLCKICRWRRTTFSSSLSLTTNDVFVIVVVGDERLCRRWRRTMSSLL